MPKYMISDGGLGSLFAEAVGGRNLRSDADAYRIRQAMDIAAAENQRNAALNTANIAKIQAETQGLTSKNSLLSSQVDAAGNLGGAYGDYFKDEYVKNHMTPENTTYGAQLPADVRRGDIPDSTAALLAAQGRTAALAMPGADPEKVAQAQRMLLGNNEMLFGTDPERIRIGASAALGSLPDDETVLSTADRDAVERAKINVAEATARAKAKAEGASVEGGSMFGGNSEYAQNARIVSAVLDKYRRGEPISPTEKTAYQIAYNKLYGAETRVQIDPQDQRQYVITTTPEIPQDLQGFDPSAGVPPSPANLNSPAPVAPPAIMSPVAPAPAQGNTTTPANAPVQTGQNIPGTNASVTTIGGIPKPLTESQARDVSFASTMNTANDNMNGLIEENGGLPPLMPMQMELMRGAIGSSESRGYLDTLLQTVANAGASAQTQKYVAAVENFINPVLRKDSGAAVPASEYPKYFARFVPVYGDKPEVIEAKKQYRAAYLNSLNSSINMIMQAKGLTSSTQLANMADNDPQLAEQIRAAQNQAFAMSGGEGGTGDSVLLPQQLSDEELLQQYGGQ